MSAIFISYRRDDTEGQAGRLFDDLSGRFGHGAVFMDVAAVEPGRDFRHAIHEQLVSCGVLLAIIGKSWLTARDESGLRRLDDPLDFVCLETAAALQRDIPVIPVLVHGARMPRASELPEDLQALCFRNGVELTHARWDSDVELLVKALQPHVRALPPVPASDPAPATKAPGIARRAAVPIAGGVLGILGLALAGHAWRQDAEQQSESATTVAMVATTRPPAAVQTAPVGLAGVTAAPDVPAPVGATAASGAAADPATKDAKKPPQVSGTAPRPGKPLPVPKPPTPAPKASSPQWKASYMPPPNGGNGWFAIMPGGDTACASYDGRTCVWNLSDQELDFARIRPLVCGEAHRKLYRTTGYEDPRHWCNLAGQAGRAPARAAT